MATDSLPLDLPAGSLITVFGASGFLGRHVVRRLAKAGYRIRAAVRRPGTAHFLRPMGAVGQVQVVQANVRYKATVENALEGADGVVNLVGVLAETGSQNFDAVHVAAPAAIAAAAKTAGIASFVHVSAIGADPDSPSEYARTKGEGEARVREAFPEAVILRPSIVFGPEDQFFNRFAYLAKFSPFLPLFGGGQTKFQPVYVADVAEAVFRVLIDRSLCGETFELGGPLQYSFADLMAETLSVTRRERVLLPLPIIAAKAVALFSWPLSFIMQPPLTFDQIKLLQVDNIVGTDRNMKTFAELGIEPKALEIILPTYLERFRKAGQFHQETTA